MLEKLERDWRFRSARSPVNFNMRFGPDGLVLGADTVLARADEGGAILLDQQDDRLLTLLTAAYGNEPAAKAIGHLRRATECWSDGDLARAELHLSRNVNLMVVCCWSPRKSLWIRTAHTMRRPAPSSMTSWRNAEPTRPASGRPRRAEWQPSSAPNAPCHQARGHPASLRIGRSVARPPGRAWAWRRRATVMTANDRAPRPKPAS